MRVQVPPRSPKGARSSAARAVRCTSDRSGLNFVMKKIGVYILLCRNKRYYLGSTNNLDRRLFEHKNGLVKATKNVLPVKLVFFQKCENLTQARRLEYQLKKKKSRRIIERIIKDGYIKFRGA